MSTAQHKANTTLIFATCRMMGMTLSMAFEPMALLTNVLTVVESACTGIRTRT